MENIFKYQSVLYLYYMAIYFFFYWIGDWYFVVMIALAQIVSFLHRLLILKEESIRKTDSNYNNKRLQEKYDKLVNTYNSFKSKPKTADSVAHLKNIKESIEIILLKHPEIIKKPLETFDLNFPEKTQ